MEKLSKEERRKQRKLKKSQHTILRHEGIHVSQHATNFLIISNGGLDNGINREEIVLLFSEVGVVVDVIMKTGKPYCFVTMDSVESAEAVYNQFNGRVMKCPGEIGVPGITFYISYANSVPGVDIPDFGQTPPGLQVIEDFISESAENLLLNCIKWEEKDQYLSGSDEFLKHRRVKHYGYEFMYDTNNIDINRPLEHCIPVECRELLEKAMKMGLISVLPDQLTVNQYLPGQGIPPHVDTHSAFEETILSLSLGSQIVMEFKHPDKTHCSVFLPERSLLVMTDEARYQWTHGITPRKSDLVICNQHVNSHVGSENHEVELHNRTDDPLENQSCEKSMNRLTLLRRNTRTSFTFRKVRGRPCACEYEAQCDSQHSVKKQAVVPQQSVPTCDREAKRLEETLVHNVYEEIASHFSDTRHSPWPKVVEFLTSIPHGSIILDIGCGNGKYLYQKENYHFKIGCDRSTQLCEICVNRGFSVAICDCLSVPFRTGCVDAVICIAVIHHLSTEVRRMLAVREVARVLRPGGLALISVWALEQKLNNEKSNYLKPEKEEIVHNSETPNEEELKDNSTCNENELSSIEQKFMSVHVNRTPFATQDTLVPWHKQKPVKELDSQKEGRRCESIYHRYYHVFKQGELEELCNRVQGVEVVNNYYDKGNWCVIIQNKFCSS